VVPSWHSISQSNGEIESELANYFNHAFFIKIGSKQPLNYSKLKVQILGTICRRVASNIVSLRHPPFILRAHSMVLAASLRLEKLCNTVPKDGNEPMLEMRLYFAAIAPNSSSASLTRLI
jgi:hypothetical protein